MSSKVWGIFLSPGRRIRTIIKGNNEVVHVQIRLVETNTPSKTLSLTVAELQLLPITKILESENNCHYGIYNGRRTVDISYDIDEDDIILTLYRANDFSEWKQQSSINFTKEEFELFNTCISEILENVSNRVLNNIAH